MAKYIVKRIAYMLVVMLILSFIMFMIYNLVPSTVLTPMPRTRLRR